MASRTRNRLVRAVSRPMGGALGATALSGAVLLSAALLPQSLEQAILAVSGVVLLVSAMLSAAILAAGRFLHLDQRADDVVEVGRERALLPGIRPGGRHWVRPAALPQAPAPVPAVRPALTPRRPTVDPLAEVQLPREPGTAPAEGAPARASAG